MREERKRGCGGSQIERQHYIGGATRTQIDAGIHHATLHVCLLTGEQMGTSPLKAQLSDLYITAAKAIDVEGGAAKAIVIFVPYKLLTKYQSIQKELVQELEKKFRYYS